MIGCSFLVGFFLEFLLFLFGCYKIRGLIFGGSFILRGFFFFVGVSGIGVFVIEVSGDFE